MTVRTARILVVEDERIIAADLQSRLAAMGYDVPATASTGARALDLAARLRPALVLMDIKLPGGMDGIDAAGRLREHFDIPVVFVTALIDDATLARATQTTGYGYVLKPFDARALGGVIEMALSVHARERRRRAKERWLQAILDSVADAVVAVGPTGDVKLMNPLAERLTGWSSAEAEGEPVNEVMRTAPRDLDAAGSTPPGVLLQTLVSRCGAVTPIESQATPILDDHGEVAGSVWVFRDVTERLRLVRAQELFARAGASLSSTLDHDSTVARVGELALSFADWYVLDLAVKDGVVETVAAGHRDPARDHTLARLTGERAPGDDTAVARAVSAGEPSLALDFEGPEELARHLGFEADLLARASASSSITVPLVGRGATRGALTLVREHGSRPLDRLDLDVAHGLAYRIAFAIDNANLYRDAQRAIQTRDDILAVVSHDLRSPLGTAMLAVTLLERVLERNENPRARRSIAILRRCGERLNRLISDLCDMGAIEMGRLTLAASHWSLDALLREILDTYDETVSAHGVRMTVSAGDRDEVHADRERILQALSNLIDNAVKFTPEGGHIHVGAHVVGGTACLSVTDSGVGIDEADVGHIFERGWQSRAGWKKGRGLGLFIVKGIASAHGGRVWAERNPGGGSTIWLTFPAAPAGQPHVEGP